LILVLAVVIGILIIAWVFFSGKAEAPLQENNDTSAEVQEDTERYTSPDNSFSLALPKTASYVIDEDFKNQQSPTLITTGVKFTIPEAHASGTNLSPDTYLSVETLESGACNASSFLDGDHKAMPIVDNNVRYTFATSSNAGAGNRYDESVFALEGTDPCIAVRYVIHYSVLENYEEGTVTQFDAEALFKEFDAIRHSLVVNQ